MPTSNLFGKSVTTGAAPRRLMLFDLSVGGHHSGYIQHLIHYWGKQQLPGQLSIVVLPQFMTQHADVVELANKWTSEKVRWVPISEVEAADLVNRSSFVNRTRLAFQEWGLFCRYAKQLKVDHAVLLYLDNAQVPIILGGTPPCLFSGIYFRPTIHYDEFSNFCPNRRDRLQQWRERVQLARVMKNSQIHTLLCLDPFVVPYLHRQYTPVKSGKVQAVHLPDPVQVYDHSLNQVQTLKQDLGIAPERQVCLLFGALTRRKGIYELLTALGQLSTSDCQHLCILLVGPLAQDDQLRIMEQIQELQKSQPIHIILSNKFVADKDIQPYFQLADVILAPYQRHVGMSAIVVRAAAAQTPLLASDYGLMGELTRRFQLGYAVDSTNPAAIAHALSHCLRTPTEELCDVTQMADFADRNSEEAYAQTFFQSLGFMASK